jgi:hypothetical protein
MRYWEYTQDGNATGYVVVMETEMEMETKIASTDHQDERDYQKLTKVVKAAEN